MSQLFPLGLQVPLIVWVGFHANGHLLGDGQPVAFQANDLFWVVREQADVFQAEVHEDLRAQAAFWMGAMYFQLS